MFHSRGDRDLGVAFQTHPGSQASSRGKQRTPLSSRVAPGISWTQLSGRKGVNTPVKFGERTRNCSPGQAGKEVPNLAMTVILRRKPINFCHLEPYVHTFLQIQMCSSFKPSFVTDNFEYGQSLCLLLKCNIRIKLVIIKTFGIKSWFEERSKIFAIWICLKTRNYFLT